MKAFQVAVVAGIALLVAGCTPSAQTGETGVLPVPTITGVITANGNVTITGTAVADNLPTVAWFLNTSTNTITAELSTSSSGTTQVTFKAPAAGTYSISLEVSHGNGSLPPQLSAASAAYTVTIN